MPVPVRKAMVKPFDESVGIAFDAQFDSGSLTTNKINKLWKKY